MQADSPEQGLTGENGDSIYSVLWGGGGSEEFYFNSSSKF